MDKIGATCIAKQLPKFLMAFRSTVRFHGESVRSEKPHGHQLETQRATPSQNFHSNNREALSTITNDMVIHEDFLSESEENSLLLELEPYLKRLRYEFSHWDDAIHGYRETEKSNWNVANKAILQRVCMLAFARKEKPLQHVHVLDISKEGYIKPHIDSIRFCGDTIAGLSLLSSSVMRLACEKNKEMFVDILLRQRSLYIMKGTARYHFTHEILPDNLSHFNGLYIPRDRRISIMCRNEPEVSED